MYTLTKYDFKILHYIYCRHNGVSRAKLLKKFKRNTKSIDVLCNLNYISHDYTFPLDKDGFPVGSLPNTAIYKIEMRGIAEIESHQWFNAQYMFTSLIVPIIVGVMSSVITALLLKLLA